MSETSELPSTRTWDGAASASASKRAQEFERAWKAARARPRTGPAPDPLTYLPELPRDRPAVLLALLRTELGLRYEAGERPRVEEYRERFPDLDLDSLVALVYEDFCLREEAGDAPVPQEYDERFPDLVTRLRRVFDIHDLVGGSTASMALAAATPPQVPFPETGQTIAGFHLRDELGRGSFARVFLAEERQLADRPVAIKVSRTGSREPQTLARLQHTHIVPVHSYRIDPATGLHLLCMPFFGRITLERLLAEPALRTACTGSDLLSVLDRLDATGTKPVHSSRTALAELPFARALSWWGARMAEALAHAHDRGVMHRDIKPSNVLITSDGLPMLLDFNLAREPWDTNATTAPAGALGGTLAYMAPEHLDAIAEGRDDRVDGRADVYSLGVLLFEALTGQRPFSPPTGGASVGETLRRAADARRASVPLIRTTHPEMPVALEAVILRCLAADPSGRHPNASALAADLQAVADERPLPFTREPLSSRGRRWVSRNRFGLTLTIPLLILASMLVNLARAAREDQSRITRQINQWIAEGQELEQASQPAGAAAKYQDAAQLASEQPLYHAQPPLLDGYRKATANRLRLKVAEETRTNADQFLARTDRVLGRLLTAQTPGSAVKLGEDLDRLLDPYASVATHPGWAHAEPFGGLPSERADRLEREVERLLMERIALVSRGATLPPAVLLRQIERGRSLSRHPGTWEALKAWLVEKRNVTLPENFESGDEASALLANSVVRRLRGEIDEAIAALTRFSRLLPGDFWCHRQIAVLLAAKGSIPGAIAQLDLALATRPDSTETRAERARLNQQIGRWDAAREDARFSKD